MLMLVSTSRCDDVCDSEGRTEIKLPVLNVRKSKNQLQRTCMVIKKKCEEKKKYLTQSNIHIIWDTRKCYCSIHSVKYNIVLKSNAGGHPKLASSGHLRRCSNADTNIKSLGSGKYLSMLS